MLLFLDFYQKCNCTLMFFQAFCSSVCTGNVQIGKPEFLALDCIQLVTNSDKNNKCSSEFLRKKCLNMKPMEGFTKEKNNALHYIKNNSVCQKQNKTIKTVYVNTHT